MNKKIIKTTLVKTIVIFLLSVAVDIVAVYIIATSDWTTRPFACVLMSIYLIVAMRAIDKWLFYRFARIMVKTDIKTQSEVEDNKPIKVKVSSTFKGEHFLNDGKDHFISFETLDDAREFIADELNQHWQYGDFENTENDGIIDVQGENDIRFTGNYIKLTKGDKYLKYEIIDKSTAVISE